jgi:hypothetical protein
MNIYRYKFNKIYMIKNSKANQNRSCLGLGTSAGGGEDRYKERVEEAECSGSIIYSCMKMEK